MRLKRLLPKDRHPLRRLKCLLNMKIPLLTISVLTAIIINPVSHIGIFLDLRDQISFTNCMNGTRLDKKHIPFMNFNLVQNFQKGLILNSLLKLLLGNFTGKSIIQAGTFLAVHDIPISVLPY